MLNLVLRPFAGESDVPAIARLENAEMEADGIRQRTTDEQTRISFSNPNDNFDPARDVTIAAVGDEVVGYSKREWVDLHGEPGREYYLHGIVHPSWRRRGVGTALLRDSEARARAVAATHDGVAPKMLGSWSADTQAGDDALLKANGYEPARWFFDMTRPNLDDIPAIPLPDGLEIRPVTPDLVRGVWDATVEAFHDHWGGFDASDESFQREMAQPTTDPTLWIVAFDGDEPAGGVLNFIDENENRELGLNRGLVGSVWTRRPWRRRGIARATIAQSLALLCERGMTSAWLDVDADNPLGALGLYEDLGFQVDFRSTAWRKSLHEKETQQ